MLEELKYIYRLQPILDLSSELDDQIENYIHIPTSTTNRYMCTSSPRVFDWFTWNQFLGISWKRRKLG